LNKLVHITEDLYFLYKNYREVRRDSVDMNNERYEGYMRGDFSVRPKPYEIQHDGVEVVRC
jgi:hypothetical protein